jgi:hypothetical protein
VIWRVVVGSAGSQRRYFLNGLNGPNRPRFAPRQLKTLWSVRTLIQRVQGSSPCAPTNQIRHFAPSVPSGHMINMRTRAPSTAGPGALSLHMQQHNATTFSRRPRRVRQLNAAARDRGRPRCDATRISRRHTALMGLSKPTRVIQNSSDGRIQSCSPVVKDASGPTDSCRGCCVE